jgi:hypothetical protein
VACKEEVRRSKRAAVALNSGDCYLLRARVEDIGESLESSWLLARAAGSERCAA